MLAGALVSVLLPAVVIVFGLPLYAFVASRPANLSVEVEGGTLRVRLSALDGVFSLRRALTFPCAAVTDVAAQPAAAVPQEWLRLPGTYLPGLIRAGSFGRGERPDFWDVRRAGRYLVISLAPGSGYRRLVLEVGDPDREALRLRSLLMPSTS